MSEMSADTKNMLTLEWMLEERDKRIDTLENEIGLALEALGTVHMSTPQPIKDAVHILEAAVKGEPTKTVIGTAESSTCPTCTAPHFVTDTAICVNCGGPIKVATKGE